MSWKLRFFMLVIAGAIVSVVVSTNIIVVRKLNPDTNFPPFADSFSNRQCSSSTCPSRSACSGGRCCMCQCLYDRPNVFVNGTSLECTNYEELNQMSAANCQYSLRRANEPMEVISLTEEATGKIRFRGNPARVNCTENGLSVDKWQFFDGNARWQDGEGGIFSLECTTVVGPDGNEELTFLKWSATLQPKYAGLIIKLLLSCSGRKVGCLLAKINGTYSTGATPVTSLGPSAVNTPWTGPATQVATGASQPGLIVRRPTHGHTPRPSLAPSTVKSSVPVVSETESRSTIKAPESAEKKQLTSNGASPESKIVWPAVGAVVGLVCVIFLVCLIMVYKRRKRRLTEKPVQVTEAEFADTDAKQAKYDKDPIYAEIQDKISDNPIYNQYTPTKEQIMKRSKLDPLPALPAHGPSCQPLLERPK